MIKLEFNENTTMAVKMATRNDRAIMQSKDTTGYLNVSVIARLELAALV